MNFIRLYKHPVVGRAYLPFQLKMVDVSKEEINSWIFKKIVNWNKNEYVIFSNANKEEIMQSTRAIRHVFLQPGEKNINSKLTDKQGIEIFDRAIKGENSKDLAKEFSIAPKTVNDIKNLRARTRITMDYLNGDKKAEPAKAIVASNNSGKKLSSSMAGFIRRDNKNNGLNTKKLSEKYHVSIRTIQKILKGDMYKETK